jgi:hypothetical protein
MRTPGRATWRLGILCAFGALTTSCEQVRVTAVEVASLIVDPSQGTVAPGDTLRLRAKLQDASGNDLENRSVVWTSDDPEVVRVEGQGLVRGISPGTTTVRASSQGATGEASITVLPPPDMVLSRSRLTFEAVAGGNPTGSRSVGVSKQGPGILEGIEVSVIHPLGEPTGWLETTLQASVAPTSVSIRADPSDLPPGNHEGRVRVSASTAANSPRFVEVTFVVEARDDDDDNDDKDDDDNDDDEEEEGDLTLAITSGDNQSGTAGEALPNELVVRVREAQGSPRSGVTVSWEADEGSASPPNSQTASNGRATTTWTLGASPGSQTLRARVAGVGSVTFNATAEAEDEDDADDRTPCTGMDALLADLRAIEDANPGSDLAEQLEEVREEVEEAYYERCVKHPPDREDAAKSIEEAVDEMLDTIEDGLIDTTQGEGFLDRLLWVSRTMAIEEIEEAEARGGSQGDIEKAKELVAEGDALHAAGEFEDAAEKYTDAISEAEDA